MEWNFGIKEKPTREQQLTATLESPGPTARGPVCPPPATASGKGSGPAGPHRLARPGPGRSTHLRAGAAHTETARSPGGLHTHPRAAARTRDAPRLAPGQRFQSPQPTPGPCRRTVTSARLSRECVTAARGRRGVYGFREGRKRFPSTRCFEF